MRSVAPGMVIREVQRSVVSRYWTTVRAGALARSTRFVDHTQRVFATRHATHASATVARQTLRERTTHASATHVERRLFVESSRNSSRSSFTERRLHSHEQRVFRALSTATHRTREESSRSHVQLVRPAMLVWRTAPQAQAEMPHGAAHASPPMTFSRPAARSAAAQELAPEAPRRATQHPLRPGDLDPALLDRLTDDVIRRVEKRVRIERERRGL
ncbi:MAG TPA: hypothetical protein VFP80_09935 [Thermoanaerobaculia bacterium]|nr:hypothetical protein [Thermoanaerobaculia bacterium]